jgi:hypothetical protein
MEYDPGQDACMVHLYIVSAVSGEEDILAAHSLCIEEYQAEKASFHFCRQRK